MDCYGCDHHSLHRPTGLGDCYEYCDTCADRLAEGAAEARADWEAWKAAGMPCGPE